MNEISDQVIEFIEEPYDLGLCNDAEAAEVSHRKEVVLGAMAERALDIATDPESTQREGSEAERLLGEQSSYVKVLPEASETEASFEAKVERTIQALAEHYAEYGATQKDFSLISYEDEKGNQVNKVIYSAQMGLDLGYPFKVWDTRRSYNSLMAENNKEHMVTIDDQEIDTRTMTEADYRAFIQNQIDQDTYPLPDSSMLDIHTFTLLPGDEWAEANCARYGRVSGRRADVYWDLRGRCGRDVRFRPAVDMADLK